MVFCAKSSLTCSRAKVSSRVHLDLEASRMFGTTPRKKIWSNFVQSYFVRTLRYGTNFVRSYFVRTLAYGTWLRSLINAPCLDWGRFGRSRQKAITASCVNSVMMEGMRYEVCLLLQWLVGAPCYGYGQSSPCMHRVRTLAYGTWLRSLINAPCLPGVDLGDPVRKQTRHHVACTAHEELSCTYGQKLPVHALCLDWGRFGRSGQKTNTASCSTCSS